MYDKMMSGKCFVFVIDKFAQNLSFMVVLFFLASLVNPCFMFFVSFGILYPKFLEFLVSNGSHDSQATT